MPQAISGDNGRIQPQIASEQRAMIVRAAALEHLDVTGFILRTVLPAVHAAVERAERLKLTERDSLKVLDLLENPPAPPERLIRAAKA